MLAYFFIPRNCSLSSRSEVSLLRVTPSQLQARDEQEAVSDESDTEPAHGERVALQRETGRHQHPSVQAQVGAVN